MDRKDQTERFYRVIWPHAAMALRTAQVLCHNATEADDLVQDTMLKAFKGLDGLREGTDAKAWLLQILRNTRIDRLRSRKADAGTLSLEAASLDPEASDAEQVTDETAWSDPVAMLQAFSDQQIIRALKELPEELRWTLLLVDVEGINHEAAAQVLEVPTGTVKSRSYRGRQMLRSALLPLAKEMRMVREG